jgi:predicted aspartyl protease
MRARWISNFVVCAALLCLSRSAVATPVNFTLRHGHLIVIPVTINGAGPHDFLVDTGASTTFVTPELAQQLRLRPIDRMELVTVTGSQLLVRSKLDSVGIGGHAATDMEVLISELREVRAAVPNVQGILGQNFLSRFNYLIDYRAHRLEFETGIELEAGLCGERMPLEEHAGRWFVEVPVNSKLRPKNWQNDQQQHWRLVPDTGLSTLLLFARGELALDWAPDTAATGLARTDVGSRVVQQRRVRSLQLGLVTFTDLPVAVLAKQADSGLSEDGLLPMNLFERVYFNHRRGYLILNPGR